MLVEVGQPVTRGPVLARLNDDAVRDVVLSARSSPPHRHEGGGGSQAECRAVRKAGGRRCPVEQDLEQARWQAMNADAVVADAEARLASAEKALGYTQIRSPLSGVVSERQVSAGDNVSAGNPMFSIVDPSSLRLEAQVPVSAIGALKVGTAVPFAIDGIADRRFEGRVTRINPAVDPATRQVRVIVGLPNQNGRLVAGLFAQGRVALESREGIVVPSSAVDRRGLRPVVTRLDAGVARRIEVALGIEDPSTDRVEITAGVALGDTLIIGAARGVPPGTKVRPSAQAERAATSN
ncbi:MAG: efflux RND transporter periplasmic adaptor subunit [Gemmatimonadales bacterium]